MLSWSHRVEEGGRRGEGWYHRVEEEGGGERGGPTVWRRREEGRGVVPPCGGGVRRGEGGPTVWRRRGEGWYHRVEEDGEGEVVQH